MNKIISKYALFSGLFLALLVFGLSVNTTRAEYYNPYYNYTNTSSYQYQDSYSNYNYSNNYSTYPNYSSTPNYSYTTYNYGQGCPIGFNLGIQNNIYVCYKFLNNNNNNISNYYSSSLIPGCYSGYIYSMLTGQRCDGYNSYYYNNSNYRNGEIRNLDVRSGSDTDLAEGDRNQEIMKIRFDVSGGDIRLNNLKLNFEFRGSSYGEDLPWNIFDRVKLLSDGKEIARINTDSRGDWTKESNYRYSINFDNLNKIVRLKDRANLTIMVDIDSSISGINNGNNLWDIFIPNRGLQARTENGDTIYAGDSGKSISIDIN